MTKFAVTERGILGAFHESPQGVRFIPWCQHQPSRKHWPTVEAALPRWASRARIIEAPDAPNAIEIYRRTV
jgi:hypothetical protein